MKAGRQYFKYILSDYIFSVLAWTVFFFFRRAQLDALDNPDTVFKPDMNLFWGLALVPIFWLFIYQLSGYYKNVVRRSRFNEFTQTFLSVLIGSVILFFILLLDDVVKGHSTYYFSLLSLFTIHFLLIYTSRTIITNQIKKAITKGKNGFKTLIIGNGKEIDEAHNMLPAYLGNIILGAVSSDSRLKGETVNGLKNFGSILELDKILVDNAIEEVIIGTESLSYEKLKNLLDTIYRHDVYIKTTPKVAEKLIGSAKLNPIYGTPFMEVEHELMPPFEENIKRVFDVSLSVLFLALFSPVYVMLAIRVKLDSKGPVFYKQERVGRYGHPFKIIKFRTMAQGAENGNGPQLTMPEDARITRFGKVMRKYRLDELPQFWNVLKGDMSVVGPRPERQFFIDQIVKKDPNYYALQKIRPGITSLGMVKYGYADNVDKMVDRLKYDIIYLENMSMLLDMKIFFYTIKTIITGEGV